MDTTHRQKKEGQVFTQNAGITGLMPFRLTTRQISYLLHTGLLSTGKETV